MALFSLGYQTHTCTQQQQKWNTSNKNQMASVTKKIINKEKKPAHRMENTHSSSWERVDAFLQFHSKHKTCLFKADTSPQVTNAQKMEVTAQVRYHLTHIRAATGQTNEATRGCEEAEPLNAGSKNKRLHRCHRKPCGSSSDSWRQNSQVIHHIHFCLYLPKNWHWDPLKISAFPCSLQHWPLVPRYALEGHFCLRERLIKSH